MRKAKILIVEDERDVLETNRDHLLQRGYDVLCAETARQALALAVEHLPDLFLLDILLPDGSGLELCRELRRFSTAPVIFLTCLDENADVIRGIEEGGDDYISKPYDLNVMSARVMAQLRRSGLAGAARVDLPPLSVDLVRGCATLAGKTVPLTQKECQLLAFLASNAGREFSRDKLYSEIWGGDAAGSATVKMHISMIRKKLELDEGSPIEITVTPQGRYVLSRTVFGAGW